MTILGALFTELISIQDSGYFQMYKVIEVNGWAGWNKIIYLRIQIKYVRTAKMFRKVCII